MAGRLSFLFYFLSRRKIAEYTDNMVDENQKISFRMRTLLCAFYTVYV